MTHLPSMLLDTPDVAAVEAMIVAELAKLGVAPDRQARVLVKAVSQQFVEVEVTLKAAVEQFTVIPSSFSIPGYATKRPAWAARFIDQRDRLHGCRMCDGPLPQRRRSFCSSECVRQWRRGERPPVRA